MPGWALIILLLTVASSLRTARASTIVVNSLNDPAGFNPAITIGTLGATVTLRDAVNAANNSGGINAIQFDPSLSGQQIDLAQIGDSSVGNSALRVSSTLSMIAPAGGLTIDRSGSIGTLRLFYVTANGNLTLTGLTLKSGAATYGAGLYNQGTVICSNGFWGLHSAGSHGSGGCVYNTGNAVFSASFTTFQGNQAETGGGAIYNDSTNANSLSIADCLVGNNYAIGYVLGGNTFRSDGKAGAIYNAGRALIVRTDIGGNAANIEGGAIQNAGSGVMTISNCFLEVNYQNSFGVNTLYGGAIRNYGQLTVAGSTFDSNSANNRGGAVASGGGSQAILIGCTFHNNSANYGSALYADGGGKLQVYNCTLAQSGNSGYYTTWSESGAILTVVNSILFNGTQIEFSGYGGNIIQSNNLVHGVSPDPQLLPYAGIYGSPLFGANPNSLPIYALPGTSPAINAGVSIPGVNSDGRNLPLSGPPDIGAFEYQGPSFVSPKQAIFLAGLTNSFSLSATGTPSTIAFYESGSLPPGVSFTQDGHLSGTPPDGSGGSYPLTLIASNGVADNLTQSFTLNVVERDTFAAHPNFKTNGLGWALNGDSINGGPSIANNIFTPTDGTGGETRSAWFRYPLYVGGFQASFTYQDVGGNGADGVAFVVQNDPRGTTAIGGGGGELGYVGITPSVGVLLNIYGGSPGGASGWLIGTNGVGIYDLAGAPSGRAFQTTTPVNLDAGNPVNVQLRYTGGNLLVTLTDTVSNSVFQTNMAIDIPSFVGTNACWVGIVGSEGGVLSHQTVSNFSFAPLPVVTISLSESGSLVFTWPATVYGFTLQANSSLNNPAGWTPVAGTVTQSGGLNQVVIANPAGSQFYRLVLNGQ